MAEPHSFLEFLLRLNRKERFFVVAAATGSMAMEGPAFRLAEDFRAALGRRLGLSVPSSALGFMDYHLDWLHAAATLASRGAGWPDEPLPNEPPNRVARGTQEDIDFVVCFEREGEATLILLEAKGHTAWTNSQVGSKLRRLTEIFGPGGDRVPGVHPILCLWSHAPAQQLVAEWPAWAKDSNGHHWLRLDDYRKQTKRLFRSNLAGKPDTQGNYWMVLPKEDPVAEPEVI